MRIPLEASISGTFGTAIAGVTACQVIVSPSIYGVTWYIDRIVVQAASNTAAAPPTFFLYKDVISTTTQKDSTYSGNNATAEYNPPLIIRDAEKLIGLWNGGPVGGFCQMNVYGTCETGR